MSELDTEPVRSEGPAMSHEGLDVYWDAQTLRQRARRVAADASCTSTLGRRLETALARAVRAIVEAANGPRDRAADRLGRAREALGLAMSYFDDLFLNEGVRDAVVKDLNDHALRLVERLDALKEKPVGTWRASNTLPTVLDEVKREHPEEARVDPRKALAKVPAAAVRNLPVPVVEGGETTEPHTMRDDAQPQDPGDGNVDDVPTPPTG